MTGEWPRSDHPRVCVLPEDFDRDCDVDLADYAAFVACFSGATVPWSGNCAWADFNGDGFVNQIDFGIFQHCFSGPNQQADPGCGG